MTLRLCSRLFFSSFLRREPISHLPFPTPPAFSCASKHILFGPSRYMSLQRRPSPALQDEPTSKRRKIEHQTPPKIYPRGAMTTNSNPKTLELTEVETTLRQLLLDVASYIDHTSVPEPVDLQVKLPDELVKAKLELRFTGGWVRDKLLGVGSHDIDVAINKMTGFQFGLKMKEYLELPGNPEKYGIAPAKAVGATKVSANGKGRDVGHGLYKIEANPEKSKHLETVTTKILGLDIDLVNLRKETYTADSRNPQMEFGTPEEDAMRRDATINAMFYNLETCAIEDFTSRGFQDMQLKIIRTPLEPYQTFKDDPLRVLRLIRFASRLNYSIDPDTEKAMNNEDIKNALKSKISRERVGIEMEKMLKGPDPHMALALIDRLGLYETIFTDPTKEISYNPDTSYLKPAYDCVLELLQSTNGQENLSVISSTLVRNPEEKYLAWIAAALIPWADAPLPNPKKGGKTTYTAQLVAREGIKAPNKICDVITSSMDHSEEIRTLKDRCVIQLKYPHRKQEGEDATARDTLGMAIRRWGQTWRSQVVFSLLYEVSLGSIPKETVVSSYAAFLSQLVKLDILEAYTYKPLITGTELSNALSARPGPWMKDALEAVMAWQLRHPEIKDSAFAIEAVKAHNEAKLQDETKGEEMNSELPARLATHFLQLTIRPLFASSQKQPNPNLTAAGRKAAQPKPRKTPNFDESAIEPWKDLHYGWALDLLRWILRTLDSKGVETNWGLLIPPILKMLDDIDTASKVMGCELLEMLLKITPPALLARTGLANVFEEALMPCLTYLPSLTPENESIVLLDKAYPALLALSNVMFPPSSASTAISTPSRPAAKKSEENPRAREKFLDSLLRQGILAGFAHAGEYVRIAEVLLKHLVPLLNAMQINSVKHLQHVLPLLSNVLAEPLGPAYPPLLLAAAKAVQAVLLNAWPRVAVHRAEVLRGVMVCWIRICEQGRRGGKEGEELEAVKQELKTCVEMLAAVLKEAQDVDLKKEATVFVEADERLGGLLEVVLET